MSTKNESFLSGRIKNIEFFPVILGAGCFLTLAKKIADDIAWTAEAFKWWGLVIYSVAFCLGAVAAHAMFYWGQAKINERFATSARQGLVRGGFFIFLNVFWLALYVAIVVVQPEQHGSISSENDNHMATASVGTILLTAANEVTRSSPITINSYTRLDGAVAGPGLLFSYLYTYTKINDKRQFNPDVFESMIAPLLRKSACANMDYRPYFDQHVSIRLVFRAVDGSALDEVLVNPSDCTAMK